MLQLIAPQEGFDFERNLQYKVFHLQSHCIFVLLMGYGALGAMTYLHELMPRSHRRGPASSAFGVPALFLSLLPLWSNFDRLQPGRPLVRLAIMAPTSCGRWTRMRSTSAAPTPAGLCRPTWPSSKASSTIAGSATPPSTAATSPSSPRTRSATPTTAHYIRDQYDPRFRPQPDQCTPFEKWLGRDTAYPKQPVTCVSEDGAWRVLGRVPAPARRRRPHGQAADPILRAGHQRCLRDQRHRGAENLREKQEGPHLLPRAKRADPVDVSLPAAVRAHLQVESRAAQDACRAGRDRGRPQILGRLQRAAPGRSQIPRRRRRHRHLRQAGLLARRSLPLAQLDAEQEALAENRPRPLPAVAGLGRPAWPSCSCDQKRFDEAIAVVKQAELDDPRNETFAPILEACSRARRWPGEEKEFRAKLAKSPYDVPLNLDLARIFAGRGEISASSTTSCGSWPA